jgi:hypothetical protein
MITLTRGSTRPGEIKELIVLSECRFAEWDIILKRTKGS